MANTDDEYYGHWKKTPRKGSKKPVTPLTRPSSNYARGGYQLAPTAPKPSPLLEEYMKNLEKLYK